MRKTYPLQIEGKNPDRLLEAAKHDIRKYIAREQRKALPADADTWRFDARLGADEASAVVISSGELIRAIDALVADGGTQFYVEVVAKAGKRSAPPADKAAPSDELDFDDAD
jgi:uroporphyrinogen-III synthase